MSIKLTKKELKKIGEELGGYYLGGNVYNYENCIYFLTSKDVKKIGENTKNKDIIKRIEKYNVNDIQIFTKQLFYSAGIYGNSGQLHKIFVYNKKNNDLVDEFFVYYC